MQVTPFLQLAFQKSPNKPTFSSLLRPPGFIGGFSKQRGVASDQEEGVALPVLTTSVSDLQSLIQELSAHYSIEGVSVIIVLKQGVRGGVGYPLDHPPSTGYVGCVKSSSHKFKLCHEKVLL